MTKTNGFGRLAASVYYYFHQIPPCHRFGTDFAATRIVAPGRNEWPAIAHCPRERGGRSFRSDYLFICILSRREMSKFFLRPSDDAAGTAAAWPMNFLEKNWKKKRVRQRSKEAAATSSLPPPTPCHRWPNQRSSCITNDVNRIESDAHWPPSAGCCTQMVRWILTRWLPVSETSPQLALCRGFPNWIEYFQHSNAVDRQRTMNLSISSPPHHTPFWWKGVATLGENKMRILRMKKNRNQHQGALSQLIAWVWWGGGS